MRELLTKTKKNIDNDADFLLAAIDEVLIVAITDVNGIITHVNDKFCEISGFKPEDLVGNTHSMVKSGKHSREFFKKMYAEISQGNTWRGNICNKTKNGEYYWVSTTIIPRKNPAGKILGYIAYRFDITSEVKARQEIKDLSWGDHLVSAFNRVGFNQKLIEAFKYNEKNYDIVLVTIGIDKFKHINKIYGHDVGDKILKEFAKRLVKECGAFATIGRTGGDEFSLFWKNVPNTSLVRKRVEKINKVIKNEISIKNEKISINVSIGYSFIPIEKDNYITITKQTSLALMVAKKHGGNTIVSFSDEIAKQEYDYQIMLSEARDGLQKGQFMIYYQPVVSVESRKVVTCEALLRWNHPTRGLLSPSAFYSILSDHFFSMAVGKMLRKTVVRDLAELHKAKTYLGSISLNLSNADFESSHFVSDFVHLINENNLSAESIILEVTETIFMHSHRSLRIKHGLRKLAAEGFPIALDDFGTGYASLTHLRELPIKYLKIDRGFISGIMTNEKDQQITKSISDLAHSLGLEVIAEGVETVEQLLSLESIGCNYLQGYYFSKPIAFSYLLECIEKAQATLAHLPHRR